MSADMQTTGQMANKQSPGTSTASAEAIVVDNLTKSYGSYRAVGQLHFTVHWGEVFALLGPNGAGKTTTVETLEGYRTPDAGSVRVLGLDPIREAKALKPQIGVMLQQDGLYPGLTAREVLHLFAGYYQHPQNIDGLLERVGLSAAAKTRCRRLSGGQKRRLALALALVGNPTLLFLDEPTSGMDPQARLATWEIIRDLKCNGATVLLTTHLMDEAERLAIARAKQLFGADHANVQPHSGAQANAAVYLALLQPGDTVLGLALDQGGHLTHGSKVNFSGKLYSFVPYGVRPDTETIDYDAVEQLAQEHKPKLIVTGFSAYPRRLDFARFRQIAGSVGALLMADAGWKYLSGDLWTANVEDLEESLNSSFLW